MMETIKIQLINDYICQMCATHINTQQWFRSIKKKKLAAPSLEIHKRGLRAGYYLIRLDVTLQGVNLANSDQVYAYIIQEDIKVRIKGKL